MRRIWSGLAVTATLTLTVTGCATEIAGVAVPDPRQPGVALTSDGYGIVTGFADAPVQLELYTEPQCSHCADLQAAFGEDLKAAITTGQLAVTYRPLTFLDDEYLTDYSAVASNTLFLAVDPATDAGTFQTYVEDLWANQDLSLFDFVDQDFADIAADSGLSDDIVSRIADGDPGVDTTELLEVNFAALAQASPESLGTPVVYDLTQKEPVDITDDNWLADLLGSS
ncbi:DsbA family protein [Mycolicibacterium mengxianglii]|uniref:DsbA family protein n=1 Tax=Mycolicibacterium mengxianglii TaxID=2736649 RepID=UPI0018D1957B|nr:thioredoxin domain-containing protein [Mycolicibacterium mengxianglii]